MPGKRRLYKSMTLPGRGRVLSLQRDDDEERGGRVFHVVTSDAPGAAPARIDGDARVDVVMTARGQDNNAGEQVAGQPLNDIILRRPKGVIILPKFVIDQNNVPTRSHFYAMWDDAPLPDRPVLNPDNPEHLFSPAPDEPVGDYLVFQCRDRVHATASASTRMQHFRRINNLTTAPFGNTRIKTNNAGPYVIIQNPRDAMPHVSARFYYGEAPAERNPLDNVLGQAQPTQATAFAVCETGAQAVAAMNELLSRQIVWNTTIAEAMRFACERHESELRTPSTREGAATRIWLPPAGAADPPA